MLQISVYMSALKYRRGGHEGKWCNALCSPVQPSMKLFFKVFSTYIFSYTRKYIGLLVDRSWKKNFVVSSCLSSVTFTVAVGLAGSILSQNQQHIAAGLYNALWFKPPASIRPPDVGIQPWAVSLDSSSCPLFTTSPCIWEEDAESSAYSKELKNQTTYTLVNFHSLKTLTECAVFFFYCRAALRSSDCLWKHWKPSKTNSHSPHIVQPDKRCLAWPQTHSLKIWAFEKQWECLIYVL